MKIIGGSESCVNITINLLKSGDFLALVSKHNDVGTWVNNYDDPSTVRRLWRLTDIIEAAEDDEELERLLHQIETYWELIRERQ